MYQSRKNLKQNKTKQNWKFNNRKSSKNHMLEQYQKSKSCDHTRVHKLQTLNIDCSSAFTGFYKISTTSFPRTIFLRLSGVHYILSDNFSLLCNSTSSGIQPVSQVFNYLISRSQTLFFIISIVSFALRQCIVHYHISSLTWIEYHVERPQ